MPSKGETKADRERRVKWLRDLVREDGEGCREWPWTRSTKGYGSVWWDGRVRRVGHVVLDLSGTPRPSAGHHQLHSCDNPPCVAPWHLRWGTNAENRAESIARGRHFTKLTDAQVLEIYVARGTHRDLAGRYGVTSRVIWQIKNGKTWTRVTRHGEAESATCPVTVTSHEWLWLRGIKCGEPIEWAGLCARHAADRDRLGEVGGLSVRLAVVPKEAS